MTEVVESEEVVTTHTEETSSSKGQSKDGTTTEVVETTTTTTTVTTVRSSTTKSSSSSSTPSPSANENNEGEGEPPSKKAKIDGSGDFSTPNSVASEGENETAIESDPPQAGEDGNSSPDGDKTIVLSNKSALAEAIKSSSDGKPKVISLQSLLPSARQTLLDAVDKGKDESGNNDGGSGTKTVLLVNREGGKVTLQVQRKALNDKDEEESSTVTSTSTSVTASCESNFTSFLLV